MSRPIPGAAAALTLLAAGCAVLGRGYVPQIPRTFDPEGMDAFELPLADPAYSPEHVPADYYYALPVRPVYRSYPIYHPDHEPDGYREMLRSAEPEIVFAEDRLETREDWVAAGSEVFRAPIGFGGPIVTAENVDDPAWYRLVGARLTPDGVFPYARWVVRERGRPEVGNLACAMCHTRLMPDGSVLEGAQGDMPLDRIFAHQVADAPPGLAQAVTHELVAAPWIDGPDLRTLSKEQIAAAFAAVPDGVIIRQGTSLYFPPKVPDLIGVRERKYLDATGLVVHRGPGDIMRYAAVNQTLDMLARYGDYIPSPAPDGTLPAPGAGTFVGTADRYSDPQLYALALFLYALEPPPNPNAYAELARRGQRVFEREGFGDCHTPPLYTNNMLVAAPGFTPPAEHYERYDVSRRRVGTDPTLATTTRRGTGYYKVPSLRGVWYRGPLEHNGSVATLEDWFDPRRLEPDYVPTGLAPPDGSPRPVRGHRFGLDLDEEERSALIAFLRTL